MPRNDTDVDPFRIDEQHDREFASDGASRYGVYLRQNLKEFKDVTADPVEFAAAAWQIASAPVMSPGYVQVTAARILSATCYSNHWDGTLLADITLATARPPELSSVRGFNEWDRPRQFGSDSYGYVEPSEKSLSQRPAMLTTTRLLLPIPTERLHVPTSPLGQVSTADARPRSGPWPRC